MIKPSLIIRPLYEFDFVHLSFSLFGIDYVLFSRNIYIIIIITKNIKSNMYALMFVVIS